MKKNEKQSHEFNILSEHHSGHSEHWIDQGCRSPVNKKSPIVREIYQWPLGGIDIGFFHCNTQYKAIDLIIKSFIHITYLHLTQYGNISLDENAKPRAKTTTTWMAMSPKSEYLKSHKLDQQVTTSVEYLALLFDILLKSFWPNCVGFYQYRALRDYHLNPGFLECGPLFIPYSELSAVCSLTMYLSKVWGLAVWVIKFPREGYKIRHIVGQKSTLLWGNYCILWIVF